MFGPQFVHLSLTDDKGTSISQSNDSNIPLADELATQFTHNSGPRRRWITVTNKAASCSE